MKMVDEKLKAFNKQENFIRFKNRKELAVFIKDNDIESRQEFWFLVEDEGTGCIYKSIFEWSYIG